jgi:hypothetical protein
MNKLIYNQSGIGLSTGDQFIETPTISIPMVSGGLLIARISGIGNNSESFGSDVYVCEMVAGFNKNDNGVLTILTTEYVFEYTNIDCKPSYVNNSDNLRIRFDRNGHLFDTNWIVDLDIYYINN